MYLCKCGTLRLWGIILLNVCKWVNGFFFCMGNYTFSLISSALLYEGSQKLYHI